MRYDYLFEIDRSSIDFILSQSKIREDFFLDKTIFITGGASGIGEQTAIGLAYLGAQVIIIDTLQQGEKVVEKIQNSGGKAHFIHKDVSKRDELISALRESESSLGPIDIIINNATSSKVASILEMSLDEWDQAQKTSIEAAVVTTKQVLPQMLNRNQGTIVNIMGPDGLAYASAASAAKSALRSLTFSVAAEIPENSSVNYMGFAPGMVATQRAKEFYPEYCEKVGIDFEDYINSLSSNIGYKGLMPVAHCAAALIWSIVNAKQFHGLIANALTSLEQSGFKYSPGHNSTSSLFGKAVKNNFPKNVSRLKYYLEETRQLNQSIKNQIETRTRQLELDKESTLKLFHELECKTTELATAKDRLEESNDDLKHFAYIVSHDLKSPLRTVSALSDFLLIDNGDKLDQASKTNLELLKSRVKKMTHLIDSILTYSIVSHSSNIDLTESDINDILNEVLSTIEIPDGFIIEVQHSLPKSCINSTQIHQVFQNLISNAINYHNKGKGKISIGHSFSDGESYYWVKDDGPGIAPKFHDKVFNHFETGILRKEKSTGLGLAITKKIVEKHKGKIWVESDGKNGSIFKFTLPTKGSEIPTKKCQVQS